MFKCSHLSLSQVLALSELFSPQEASLGMSFSTRSQFEVGFGGKKNYVSSKMKFSFLQFEIYY